MSTKSKCIKPKCQFSIARKKCINANPYIEKISECTRKNIKKDDCMTSYDKVNDRLTACDRMHDRLNYEKILNIKIAKGEHKLILSPPIKATVKNYINFKKTINPNFKYISLNKHIPIPSSHAELRKKTVDWIQKNDDYIIQPLGGLHHNYDITSLNDILVAEWGDNIAVGVDAYVARMKNTGVFSETPNIYAICEMYGVIINLFLWISETKKLQKMTFVPWKYNTDTKLIAALRKNYVINTALIGVHYYSIEDNSITDKYKPENNTEKKINDALNKKYHQHLYDKHEYRDGNCFFHVILRQLKLLNNIIK